ncbi:MAG TPA: class I SAM-dependent methyltransferase [Bryobacteraceae bacterium]|jgi:ubiquinone/menaquinone biosynthesis C-methylase UbiE|nr:class I SAM-dependent methyltransferase [Bryobacteraceae bacterium]
MPAFWRRLVQRAKPPLLPEIIQHFNQAAADEEHFPSSIDPRIYHVQLLMEYFGELNGRRVLDVGCGKGRFARVLQERYPRSDLVAFDLAEAMLRCVPSQVHACAGSMTALPFLAESFDCAYATESLEHAVDIDAAVAEMCRVVKPGGRIAIIDKNAAQWGRLKTPSWEKWFDRKQLERILENHCSKVSSREISYWEDVAPDGLFLAWLAEK